MQDDAIKEIYSKLNSYEYSLTNKKVLLEKYKKDNEDLEVNQVNLRKAEELYGQLSNFLQIQRMFYKLCTEEDTNYKNRRVDFLSTYIDKNLEVVFPLEGFKSKIKSDFKYNSGKVELHLIDKAGNDRIPYITEGKLCQELISFSSGVGVTECLGKNIIYMDEAFAASSKENLAKVSRLINEVVQNRGMQVILIEQSAEAYKDIPRREIRLYKDAITDSVVVEDIIDY